jgi:hypothetical protein
MSVIQRLAVSLGRRDEVPNQELAKEIINKNDGKAVKELVENLNNKDKNIQSDCIKVLYEIGEQEPKLIAPYVKEFISLLDHKNNRLQWGAMAAIDYITSEKPDVVYSSLVKIISLAEKGSVITRDHAVNILIKLCSVKNYSSDAFSLLIEQLLSSPVNQLPMYAERAMPAITAKNSAVFVKTLSTRLKEVEQESKRKRIEKVIRKFS